MRPLLAAVLLAFAVPGAVRSEELPASGEATAAPFYKAGLKGTVGSGHYKGRSAYFQLGRDWTAKGTYSDYRFDGSTGTTRSLGVKLGWQGESLSLGANFSAVPRNDSYSNRAFGLDASYVFNLNDDDADGGGFEEVETAFWWNQTRHLQVIPATPLLPVAREFVINQHDLGASVSVTAWDFTLSVDGTKTHYDQDFSGLPRAALLRPRLGETADLVNGFPDAAGSARLEWGAYRVCVPYVSAAVTRYKIQPQPNSATYGLGATMRRGRYGLDLGYELTRVKGASDSKYLTFAGAVKF